MERFRKKLCAERQLKLLFNYECQIAYDHVNV